MVTYQDDGTRVWRLDGKNHREDASSHYTRPDGYKAWYLNGVLHRENGPAFIYPDGSKQWWINGKQVSEADVMGHTITIDGTKVGISAEEYKRLRSPLC